MREKTNSSNIFSDFFSTSESSHKCNRFYFFLFFRYVQLATIKKNKSVLILLINKIK